jgi:hypothetical protein
MIAVVATTFCNPLTTLEIADFAGATVSIAADGTVIPASIKPSSRRSLTASHGTRTPLLNRLTIAVNLHSGVG